MGRKYVRDNRGRFASVGATARGGRLKTAGGNKRATVTARAQGAKGSRVARPKGYKPDSVAARKTGLALNRWRKVDQGRKPDIAEQHIPGRFKGQAGKRLEGSIDRAVKDVKRIQDERWNVVHAAAKAERAASKAAKDAAAAAKPKRTRSAQSVRVSRARKIVRNREIKTSGTLRQWQNAKRTQERALAYYGRKG